MATGTVFDYPDLPTGVDASAMTLTVDLRASVNGQAIGFIPADDRSIGGAVSKTPDATGRVEFAGLAYNTDISPAGTVYRAEYQYGSLVYKTVYFAVSVVGPTWIGDIRQDPTAPIPDPTFSADYSEDATLTNNTTTSTSWVSFSPPLVISPTITTDPILLIANVPRCNSSGAGGLAQVGIHDTTSGSTLVADDDTNSTTSVQLQPQRRFAAGFWVPGARTFELKKKVVGSVTGNFNPGSTTPVSLEALRR